MNELISFLSQFSIVTCLRRMGGWMGASEMCRIKERRLIIRQREADDYFGLHHKSSWELFAESEEPSIDSLYYETSDSDSL